VLLAAVQCLVTVTVCSCQLLQAMCIRVIRGSSSILHVSSNSFSCCCLLFLCLLIVIYAFYQVPCVLLHFCFISSQGIRISLDSILLMT
jgi:hypothetical protein